MIGFVINLTYNLTNPFLMLIIELMQYITIYFKGPFADDKNVSEIVLQASTEYETW
jgi:hypothetical protein